MYTSKFKNIRAVLLAVALLTLLVLPVNAADDPPWLSEIVQDQTGTDNDEFVELAGTPGLDLSDYTLIVIGDGPGGSGVVESVVSLSGQSIPNCVTPGPRGNCYFVVAESTFTLGTADYTPTGSNPLNHENTDNVTHMLVTGFTGALNQDIDTNDDGTLDSTPWTTIVECVALLYTSSGGDLTYCATAVGPVGSAAPGHVWQCTTGWNIGASDLSEHTAGAAASNCPDPTAVTLTTLQARAGGRAWPLAAALVVLGGTTGAWLAWRRRR